MATLCGLCAQRLNISRDDNKEDTGQGHAERDAAMALTGIGVVYGDEFPVGCVT